jgi:hypothetical protein
MQDLNSSRAGAWLASAGALAMLVHSASTPGSTNAAAVDLYQCANGSTGTTTCTANAWSIGNVSASSAYWYEGDSVPVRAVFGGLTTGVQHSVTFDWRTTTSSKHAYDYLTRFDRTASTADPCSGVTGCSPGSFTTAPIPLDPLATASITQIAGEFVMYGASIDGVSSYGLSGSYAGDSSTEVTITFTPTVDNPVLVFAAHLASRKDWGSQATALSIAGSPYHVRATAMDGSGITIQDRGLSSAAVHGPQLVVDAVVINYGESSFVPGDFLIQAIATDPTPDLFAGAPDPGTVVLLAPGDYRVKLATQGYGATYSEGCMGTIDVPQSIACTVTIDTDVIFIDAFEGP